MAEQRRKEIFSVRPNRLYFGDCLDIMRAEVGDESVDLVYLDPPFNSKRIYNAFIGGAQWVAFKDTWQWHEAAEDFRDIQGDAQVGRAMEGLRMILGEGPNLAYLSYMAVRLRECRRVLKPTGSIYLHCDPTASHYLKALMDGLFGTEMFRNEIVWKRTGAHGGAKRWGPIHDLILFYTKSDHYHWNRVYQDYDASYIAKHYRHEDEKGRYQLVSLTGAGTTTGDSGKPWRGIDPTDAGRHWAVPGASLGAAYPDVDQTALSTQQKLDLLDEAGYVHWPERGSVPRQKRYLNENPGVPIQDIVSDIPPIGAQARERLGYPTQKPVTLLERIIRASSNEGDVVLDPFCGCGTTTHAAQQLNRRWIGIDVCVNACKVIQNRIENHFDSLWDEIEFVGIPTTVDDARALAEHDPFKFEKWAASIVPGVEANKTQRGDRGIDGRGRLPIRKGTFVDVVSQVKAGNANPGHVQAFRGAMMQANADMGVFTCFEDKVTRGMKEAAVNAGRFQKWPVLQIYTVEDYFAGRKPDLPLA